MDFHLCLKFQSHVNFSANRSIISKPVQEVLNLFKLIANILLFLSDRIVSRKVPRIHEVDITFPQMHFFDKPGGTVGKSTCKEGDCSHDQFNL